jgi:hypothetical protein
VLFVFDTPDVYPIDRNNPKWDILAVMKRLRGFDDRLLIAVINEFRPRFMGNGEVVYLRDGDRPPVIRNAQLLSRIGLTATLPIAKMPSAIIRHARRGWLALVETAGGHGPIDFARRTELEKRFREWKGGLVFVTILADCQEFLRFQSEIPWETSVWLAREPTHIIIFGVYPLLGPYPNRKRGKASLQKG